MGKEEEVGAENDGKIEEVVEEDGALEGEVVVGVEEDVIIEEVVEVDEALEEKGVVVVEEVVTIDEVVEAVVLVGREVVEDETVKEGVMDDDVEDGVELDSQGFPPLNMSNICLAFKL